MVRSLPAVATSTRTPVVIMSSHRGGEVGDAERAVVFEFVRFCIGGSVVRRVCVAVSVCSRCVCPVLSRCARSDMHPIRESRNRSNEQIMQCPSAPPRGAAAPPGAARASAHAMGPRRPGRGAAAGVRNELAIQSIFTNRSRDALSHDTCCYSVRRRIGGAPDYTRIDTTLTREHTTRRRRNGRDRTHTHTTHTQTNTHRVASLITHRSLSAYHRAHIQQRFAERYRKALHSCI